MHGDAPFLIELGLLLVLLGVAGAIALRIGLSAAPLFLVAGLLASEGGPLAVVEARAFLDSAAVVGAVLLLLVLGMEFSSEEFTSALKRHAPSGLVDFLLSAPPGFLVGWLLGWPVAACLAMGGVTWVSSSGIIAKVLGDLGRLGFRETPAVLSVLVLEDIAMAAFLPLVGVLLVGGGFAKGVTGAAVSTLAVVAVILLARFAERGLDRVLRSDSDEQVLLRILGLTLLVAGLAEWFGISAAVGAFLVGLAVPQESAAHARKVLEPLRDLFAAAFFLMFGVATDIASVIPVLPWVALLAVVTSVTKIATGWYAAAREGVAPKGRIRAGTALVARGEFSILIAGIAVASGFDQVGPLATGYVLVMAVLGPVLARFADPLAGLLLRQPAVVSPRAR